MKKNTNSVSDKIKQLYNGSDELFKVIKDFLPFDFYCPNDQCGGKNGVRQIASAWKSKNGMYNVFCQCCGQETELSNSELKAKKIKFDKEAQKHDQHLDDDEEMYIMFEE